MSQKLSPFVSVGKLSSELATNGKGVQPVGSPEFVLAELEHEPERI